MEMTPLAPNCGVEITDVALADADGAVLEALKQAVFEHGVAVVRDQDLTPDQHIAFARRWGGIDINNYFPLEDEWPEIAIVRKVEDQTTNIGGGWHTDHSYDQIPAMGSILVARTLPPKGGDTLFASMGAAYDALPPHIKEQVAGLRAVHSADHIYSPEGYYAGTDMGADLRGQGMQTGAVHPVVIRHPVTGRQLLYVNPSFTLHFESQTREQSLPLLSELFAAAMREDVQCRVIWKPGSVAIWDNRATWHNAVNDYQGHARVMHRITLSGEALAA
ncbi:TauD/TfdA dioxygenase family protein [Qipengyuania marisflavi]|uniref:TauD/TfdA family dioxygenase n=1 Tax=Qipengyuania marisflavi TaxID=2486356 RepID=A0A5S3PAF7_9SPHN|nr:TauD/TfdA family dioxygenase [Qipengyuania marisflavi]TMM50353.1 TauD/TfdA family dioxygenase [Qipengyuania marisflavi]